MSSHPTANGPLVPAEGVPPAGMSPVPEMWVSTASVPVFREKVPDIDYSSSIPRISVGTAAAPVTEKRTTGIIAVIPAFNEELFIGTIVVRTKRQVDKVIVVDDGSQDRTAEVAEIAGAEVIRLEQNTGKAYAILLGLKRARELRCTVAVVLEGNGQYDPREIPRVTGQVLSGKADLVIGSRYQVPKENAKTYQKMFDRLHLASGTEITDSSSTFEAFSSNALDHLDFRSTGIELNRDLISFFDTSGLKIHEVAVTFSEENNHSSWQPRVRILAAMPAFNEEKFIAKTILGAQPYVDRVLVVDDGSSDATCEIAKKLGAIVVCHKENQGYGAALRTIFEKARELHAEALVILVSDGQHNPKDIDLLIQRLSEGDADVVIGSRFIGDGKDGIPSYRIAGMKVLNGATKIAGVDNITDSQSGFRAYGKRAIESIHISGEGMSAGSEILIRIAENNLRIAEVPIKVRYDIEDTSSQNPIRHGVSVLSNIISLITYRRPLPFFGIPGTIILITGLIFGFWAFTEYYATSKFPFVLSMVSAVTLIMGLLMIIAGFILNVLVMIMSEQKLNKSFIS